MSAEQFKIRPHIADVRMFVKSPTLEGLFTSGLLGMNEILKKGFCKTGNRHLKTFEIRLSALDTTSLLIDFLSDVLTLTHIHKTIFCHVQFQVLGEKHLLARITGSEVGKFDRDIKAVSYHEAEIVKDKKGNYSTSIIFDI